MFNLLGYQVNQEGTPSEEEYLVGDGFQSTGGAVSIY